MGKNRIPVDIKPTYTENESFRLINQLYIHDNNIYKLNLLTYNFSLAPYDI